MLAAAAQAAVLLAVGGFVLAEAIRRLIEPSAVASGAMVVFGVVGLAGNAVSIGLLSRISGGNLNTRAALLEVINDALGSVAALIAAAVIALTGWDRADAVASLLIGALILPRTWKLPRETVDVLMEAAPPGRRPGPRPRPHPRGAARARGARPARELGGLRPAGASAGCRTPGTADRGKRRRT